MTPANFSTTSTVASGLTFLAGFLGIGFQKSETSRKIAVEPMRSESGTSDRLQIGHVLFMDLVGYSTLLLDDQRRPIQLLDDIGGGERLA